MSTVSPAAAALGACAVATAAVCAATVAVTTPTTAAFMAAPAAPAAALSAPDAVRLAKQAAFGATPTLITQMTKADAGAWLDAQFALPAQSSYADLISRDPPRDHCHTMSGAQKAACTRDYFSSTPVAMRFYADAVNKDDQLRQRVAFALSQLMVASDQGVHSTVGLAALNQIFLDKAFGNYRDLLGAVTLNAYMGDYLDLGNSKRNAPNENYAREVMQLFSIGVSQLNPDGTPKTDASGAPIATYTPDDVHDIARALTGLTFQMLPNDVAANAVHIDYSKPMVSDPTRYDGGSKTFLGVTIKANTDQATSQKTVLDTIFNHANTAPFVSKFLIQQLVKANPSPAYVARIAAVFADNGSGVRGDLKAVVRAILLDPEARGSARTPASEGKVKEPVLFAIGLARAIGMDTDGYAFTNRDDGMAEAPFRAPSVFNFYPKDYPLPQGAPLISPTTKLMNTATTIARHNLAYDWTVGSDVVAKKEFPAVNDMVGSTGTAPRWSDWEAYGTDVDSQLDRINLTMLENGLSTAQRTAIRGAMTAITAPDKTAQARRRAQVALYLAASSPLFQIDR